MKVNDKLIKDILVGEVWLCSGQSNMELPINRVLDLYRAEVENANNSKIREFAVPLKYDFNAPTQDLSGGTWQSVNPKDVLRFSAVAYFFAKDLYQKYGLPVGIIRSAVGGSPIEAWLPEERLNQYPAYQESSRVLRKAGYMDSIRASEGKMVKEWNIALYKADKGISGSTKWYGNDRSYIPCWRRDGFIRAITATNCSFCLARRTISTYLRRPGLGSFPGSALMPQTA